MPLKSGIWRSKNIIVIKTLRRKFNEK